MRAVKEYAIITLGIVIVAMGLHLFLVPGNIAAGGAMGIAIVAKRFLPFLSVGHIMLAINILLFGLAFITVGLDFGIRTVYASLGLSGFLWVLDMVKPIEKPLVEDLLLATVMGIIISGLGMAIVFNQDASSGGTDIIAKILNRSFHMDIGKALLLTDAVITIAATFVFGFERGTYALLGVIANGFVIDYIVEGFNVSMQVIVISHKADTISRFIMDDLDRGVTILAGQGGHSGRKLKVLYSVLDRKEFIQLREYIKEVAPRAFVTVSKSHEVIGEGFGRIE